MHRKHASVYDVAQRLPHAAGRPGRRARSRCSAGSPSDPERPYVVVLGGSKVSDKLGVIDNLLGKADRLLIGGGMVFTFLEAQGHEVGKSLLEEDQLDTCRGYLRRAEETGVQIVLPIDIVVAPEFSADAAADRGRRPTRSRPTSSGLDIGPDSGEAFADGARRRQDRVLERPDGRVRVRRRSPPAPGPSPRRSPRSTGCPSSAAATPPPRSASSASTRPPSATSPPAAARAWSTSRARRCPGIDVLAD